MTTKVRASKFRHVFGKPLQQTECYRDVTTGNISTESTVIKANEHFWAVPWKTQGGICVVPHPKVGAVLEDGPLILNVNDDGDKPALSDFNFSPHDNFLIALAGVDGSAALYRIPSPDGLSETINQAERRIKGGDARLLGVDWHPLASGLIYTTSAKKEVVFWDVDAGSEVFRLPEVHKGLLNNTSWNKEGSLIATSAKDKFVRIFDPRNQQQVGQVEAHQSIKGARVQWANSTDYIVTAGFTKTNERELAVFDPRNLGTRVQTVKLSPSSSNSLLFEDADTGLLLVAGKGDGNISFFEFEDGVIHYLTEYKSNAPQNGLALLPKKSCNLAACEVIRIVKLSGTKVEPIRIEVPRSESSFFQEDLFPPTWDLQATMSAGEWLSGANTPRNVVSLNPN